MREVQYDLAAKNGVFNLDMPDIMNINSVGTVIYMTRNTQTHIKGTRLEALFGGGGRSGY